MRSILKIGIMYISDIEIDIDNIDNDFIRSIDLHSNYDYAYRLDTNVAIPVAKRLSVLLNCEVTTEKVKESD